MENIFNLYLVRHGESYNNSVAQSQRVCDPPLTDLGQTQARHLADRLRDQFHFPPSCTMSNANSNTNSPIDSDTENPHVLDRVYTSAFLRTMQTIYPTTQLTGVRPQIWTDLFEVGGCFDGHLPGQTTGRPGMTETEIAQQFTGYAIPPDIDDAGWWKSKPRETTELAEARTARVVQQLHERYYGKEVSVLCVIHGDLIRMLMRNLAPDQPGYGSEVTHNTSLTHLRFTKDQTSVNPADVPRSPQVVLFNDTSHLTDDLLST